jgi:hypothetical protein
MLLWPVVRMMTRSSTPARSRGDQSGTQAVTAERARVQSGAASVTLHDLSDGAFRERGTLQLAMPVDRPKDGALRDAGSR